jgi:hypothetical protein
MGPKAPIYLVSVPRSGATLLSAMLNNHKCIAMFNEPWFSYMLPRYESFCRQGNVEPLVDHLTNAAGRFGEPLAMEFKESLLAEIGGLGLSDPVDVLALFMERYAKHKGKQRWGIKQPFGMFYVHRLLRSFPGLKVIHIVRDPRATVAERMNKELNREEDLVNSFRFSRSYSKIMWFADRMKRLKPKNYLELRYEDLVTSPEAHLMGICEFLEEEFDPEMSEYYKAKNLYVPREDDGSPRKNHLGVLRPVNPQYVDVWRNLLTLREIAVTEKVCYEAMVERGYYAITSGKEIGAILSLKTVIRFWWTQVKAFVRNWSFERVLYKFRNGLVLYHN